MITTYLTKRRQDIAILMMPVVMMNIVGTGGAGNDAPVDVPARSSVYTGNDFLFPVNNAVDYGQRAQSATTDTTDNAIVNDRPVKDFHIDKVDIGGPGQPEMQAFQSVGANNMVDLFTGDFSYSIPLLDVGGYPVGLSYRGGASMDQEASWVGLGWNINPGTITRNMRGLPDDFNGKDSITKELNTKKKWTAGVNVEMTAEMKGKELKWLKNPTIGIYYDNYTGPGFSVSTSPVLNAGQFSLGDKTLGVGSIGLDVSFDSKSGFNLNPSYDAKLKNTEASNVQGYGSIGLNYNSRAGVQGLQMSGGIQTFKEFFKNERVSLNRSASFPMFSSLITFNSPTFTPSINMPTTFYGFTYTQGIGGELFGFHPKTNLGGYYNQNYIAPKDRVQRMPAYGYLYMSRSVRDAKALMDFNREKDIPYRKNVPNIAVPFQTYDIFSISGEGVGGSFRAYRGDGGIMRDHQVKSKSISGNLGLDFGHIPNLFIGGIDARFTYAYTENKKWEENNAIKQSLVFKESDSTYEAVYFRNPGEQTSNTSEYYQSIGDEDLVRVNLTGGDYNPTASNKLARFNKYNQFTGLQIVNKPIAKINRDKRAQVISYLSAKEAALVGLDKEIRSFPVNNYPLGSCDSVFEKIPRVDGSVRKEDHISLVSVLNPDGMQYIYGIPAYNLVQKEATFSVNKGEANTNKGLVSYGSSDLSTNNNEGKDGYFNMQTTPAYAHSYLLTALLSPGYVDVTGNGITDDDLGDAVKFNYTRMKWDNDASFKWRTPTDEDQASYDEGLRTDNSDDKGHITYGEKEIWYLNSIESKTMIAVFKLDTDSLRKDGFEVKDINGGRSTNPNKRLMRLKEIELFSKADVKKYGTSARPIKKVVFGYSYRLCKGYPDLQDTTVGKLTLESVRFFYNGSKKGKDNPYIFNYASNPTYKYKAYDRWGNYKPASSNPGSIPSDEYPYAVKDSSLAAQNAGAWALSSIRLPSGALMKVTYEADDYAFVQNKTANEMFNIVGFGTSPDSTSKNNNLYQGISEDKKFVFIRVPGHVASKSDVWSKYLRDQNKLYFRLHVKMPHDSYGSGYEYIPVYADIKDYGRANDSLIWIELQSSPEGNKKSPLATAAIQFLRLNLPSKAYPGSDVGNDPVFVGAIRAVLSIVGEAQKLLFGGFGNDARIRGKAKEVMLDHSFVRLSTPAGKKYGGGYRVRRITIQDNWQKMTGKKESVYGQEYEYTTTKTIGGKKQIISSGVASYEPSIGNEENPFHQPVEYTERATLAPSNFLYVEEPFGECLFPGANVGYSKVRVSSINRKNIKSAPGFEESEFYTAYDFPTLTQRTQFDNDSHKKGIDKFVPFAVRTRKFITLSQGFKLELNDMHGKPKSNAVYAETDPIHPISYTAQYYRSEKIGPESYKLVNTVPVIDSADGKINQFGQIGKDIELVTDMREQYSSVTGGGLNFNVDVSWNIVPLPPFIVMISFTPQFNIQNSRYRSVSMLKVIQRYGILDSVVVIDKGSKISTRNLVWDGETGGVLVTQTQNEFNDPVYQFQYPAHWAYPGVGPAYKNIDAQLHKVCIHGGRMVRANGSLSVNKIDERIFESGDEILIENQASYHILEGCRPPHVATESLITPDRKVWVVDRGKVSGNKEVYFITRDGREYTGHNIDIRVIRSGRRNMASSAVGSIVSLKTPIRLVDGKQRIVIDSTIDVVATSAAVMKDVWPVENRLYKLNNCDSTNITVDTTIYADTTALVKRWTTNDGIIFNEVQNGIYPSYGNFTASRHRTATNIPRHDKETRGIVKFDFGFIPGHAIVDSAQFNLYAKAPRNLWANTSYFQSVNDAHILNINQSELLHITQSWSSSTTLQQTNSIITQANKVTLPSSSSVCQDYSANIKDMVQAMVEQPSNNYGILFKLNYPDSLEFFPTKEEANHMSFCGLGDTINFISGCHQCTPLALRLKYHYRKDSCIDDCESVFDNPINPYTHGIWGIWRGSRSYVYYDRRRESDPLTATNIRKDGVIKNFMPFWALSSSGITATSDEYRWVWNSEITRFNRRGLETENHDPLGRFNSGLYGYNNTLPIAVAQNARHRETAFDGFEDYSFATDSCVIDCPLPRHLDFSAYKDSIVTTQKHTGKASLRLGAGSTATVNMSVKPGVDSLSPTVNFSTEITSSFCKYFESITASDGAVYPGFMPIPGKLMVVSAWVKEDKDCKCLSYTGNKIDFVFYKEGDALDTKSVYTSGNIIEGWQRYEDTVRIPPDADSMSVKLRNTTTVPVYFDDFRMHPYHSNMKSFVYHPTNLRLLSELDENNFASFYEYDDEGTLIRTKKETERGVKTIAETRSAIRKNDD